MPNPLVQPVPQFNFTVTMWDTTARNTVEATLTTAASALLNVTSSILFGAFSEVQGLNADIEVETYQQGGLNDRPLRFFKYARFQNLVLKRGVTFNPDLWDWHQQVATGRVKVRKSGVVVLYDRGGPNLAGAGLPLFDRLPAAAWVFHNGLPEKLQGPALNAKSNEMAIESLEISHERLQRLSLSLIPGLPDLNSAVGAAIGVGATAGLAVGGGLATGGGAALSGAAANIL